MNNWIDELDYIADEREDEMVDVSPDADTDQSAEDFADTLVIESKTLNSDNVGGSSVELNVADLLAEVEAESFDGVDAEGRVRRRLEAILERKRRHDAIADFDDYDLDS